MATEPKQGKAFYFLIAFTVAFLASFGIWFLSPVENILVVEIAFGVSAALCAAWLTFQYQERKRAHTLRGFKYAFNAAATVTIVIAGVFIVNFIATKHDFRKDLTKNQRQSISPQIKKVVESLTEKVFVKSFLDPRDFNMDAAVKDFMQNVKASGGEKIEYQAVNVAQEPWIVRAYEITQANTIVLEIGEKGDRREKIKVNDASDIEEKFANGLIKLTRTTTKKVYFLKGHGERSIADQQAPDGYATFKEELTKASFTVEELSLLEKGAIPTDTTVLVIAGPRKEPLPPEIPLIKNYLLAQGNVMFLADPDTPQKWNEVISDFSVSFSNRIILEPNALAQMAQLSLAHPVIVNYNPSSDIGKEAKQPTLYYIADDLELKEDHKPGIEHKWVAKTGERSWGETNLVIGKKEQKVQFDAGKDKKGPLIIAATSVKKVTEAIPAEPVKPGEEEKKPQTKESRLFIVGDSDFASNQYFQQLGNLDMTLNAVAWLSNDADLISIRPKPKDESKLEISAYAARWIRVGTLGIYPVLLLGIAFFIYRRRLAL